MLSGYLKRISNMKSAIRECADDTVDAIVVWGSYKQSRIAGKFNRREHFREALVSAQDSTGRPHRPFSTARSFRNNPNALRRYSHCASSRRWRGPLRIICIVDDMRCAARKKPSKRYRARSESKILSTRAFVVTPYYFYVAGNRHRHGWFALRSSSTTRAPFARDLPRLMKTCGWSGRCGPNSVRRIGGMLRC